MNEHAQGLLIGLIAGDRIGGPGQMALQLAESLHDLQCFDPLDIGLRYLQWWKEDGYDAGQTAAKVFSLVNFGKTFDEATSIIHAESGEMTAGCNPVHRNTPLAMSNNVTNKQLEQFARKEAKLTHIHHLAGEVAALSCLLSRYLIDGLKWETSLDKVTMESNGKIRDVIERSSAGEIYADGYAPNVLGAAIYFVNHGSDFDDTLQTSIDFAGLANFCPVLVGSLAGARWGASGISDAWLSGVKNIAEIKNVSHALGSKW